MKQGKNRRLANVKTRRETGLEYVMLSLDLNTPFGKKKLKEIKPFYPGEEEALRAELDRVEQMIHFVKQNRNLTDKIQEVFMEVKDPSLTVSRSGSSVLSVVELYEVKSLLLQMRQLRKLTMEHEIGDYKGAHCMDEMKECCAPESADFVPDDEDAPKVETVPEEYFLEDTEDLLDELDPRGDRLNIFYIYDEFSPLLGEFRGKKREFEKQIRREQKAAREELRKNHGVNLTPKFDIVVAKSHPDYLVKPEIVGEHVVEFENGRNLQVEDIIKSKGKEYCPVSISLKDGVTLITGANMGGKTISLKLSGQIPILAQYGFFVPAEKARIGLSNYMQILIGDSQSVERGLSSFGSEMEELKEILDNADERSLILVDEIASGTNPTEGTALTKSLVDYLMEKPYISLITTHFESVTEKEGVVNMQVRGLAGCDFNLLNSEIQHANRRDRINIISKYMDYRLQRVENEAQVPKDALSIASMLGISREIIEGAKKYIR